MVWSEELAMLAMKAKLLHLKKKLFDNIYLCISDNQVK